MDAINLTKRIQIIDWPTLLASHKTPLQQMCTFQTPRELYIYDMILIMIERQNILHSLIGILELTHWGTIQILGII